MRRKSLVSLTILLGLMLLLACGCNEFQNREKEIVGNYEVVFNSWHTKACVLTYYWDGDPEHTTIDLSEKIDGARVTSLGGYMSPSGGGTLFMIDYNGPDAGKNSNSYDSSQVEYESIVFTIKLGRDVDNILDRVGSNGGQHELRVEKEDGSVIIYHLSFYVECDSGNSHYYSEDGKLYSKDGSLVKLFSAE